MMGNVSSQQSSIREVDRMENSEPHELGPGLSSIYDADRFDKWMETDPILPNQNDRLHDSTKMDLGHGSICVSLGRSLRQSTEQTIFVFRSY